jgi:hypothetical protein
MLTLHFCIITRLFIAFLTITQKPTQNNTSVFFVDVFTKYIITVVIEHVQNI